MSIQQINMPSLLGAVALLMIAAVAIGVFRRPAGNLVSMLGHKISKFSITFGRDARPRRLPLLSRTTSPAS
jgi:hypothetical protein